MCTALVSFDPEARFPLLLAGIRDEFADRAWDPPGEYWPDRPGLLGGRDRLAGGTWLAVDPAGPRVGCVLNGTGVLALEDRRLSRGDLPLRAAGDGGLGDLDLTRLDPFHLICGEPSRVRLWSWTGTDLTDQWLEPGLHIVVNTGLDGTCLATGGSIPKAGLDGIRSRLEHFTPRLAAVERPEPGKGDTEAAWGSWLPLVEGDGLDPADPRALLLRHEGERVFASTSVSLVALAADAVRYDFSGRPGERSAWRTIIDPR